MHVATTIAETQSVIAEARKVGHTIGFVPTMGALHEGHGRLVEVAKEQSSFVVVSIFVNPTQFGPNEDFHRYPRTLEADRVLCEQKGASLIFAPTPAEMYPDGSRTFVEVPGLQDPLCGPTRPGHFRGVATVVLKLFNIVLPDLSVFGQKDAQQARIIQQMVVDLNVPVKVIVAPTVRESDGLAMSSRNRYLSPTHRHNAASIYAAMKTIESKVANGETSVATLENELRTMLQQITDAKLDYAQILDAMTLHPIEKLERSATMAIALFLGTTRLIDNLTLTPP